MTRKRTSENDLLASTAAPARRKATTRSRAKYPAAPSSVETPSTPTAEPEIATAQAVPAFTPSEPSREEIAKVAYLYWEARGFQGGSSEEDWLRAEQELRSRSSAATA